MNAKESLNKQELKVWGLLKSREDYDFFYRITGMLSDQKISEFGKEFLTDLQILTDIVKTLYCQFLEFGIIGKNLIFTLVLL